MGLMCHMTIRTPTAPLVDMNILTGTLIKSKMKLVSR